MIEPANKVQQYMPKVKIMYARILVDEVVQKMKNKSDYFSCYGGEFEDLFNIDFINKIVAKHQLKPLFSKYLKDEIKCTFNNIFYYMNYFTKEYQENDKATVVIKHGAPFKEYISHNIPMEYREDMRYLEQQVANEILNQSPLKEFNNEMKRKGYIDKIEMIIQRYIKNSAYQNQTSCEFSFKKNGFSPDRTIITEIINNLVDNGYHVKHRKMKHDDVLHIEIDS